MLNPNETISASMKKFTMDMPASMHRKLKLIAAENSTTCRQLVIEAIEKFMRTNHQ
jgi:predicted HicB family RNase H-like nuclease